jgi:hypothetical protein
MLPGIPLRKIAGLQGLPYKHWTNQHIFPEEEMIKKGGPFKENTLKHYIQTNQIPRPERREGMISYHPANTIRHLNFTRYCIFSGSETSDKLNSLFEKLRIQDKNILREKSEETGMGSAGDDCIHLLWIGFSKTEEGSPGHEKR